jgi:hypothetical protein
LSSEEEVYDYAESTDSLTEIWERSGEDAETDTKSRRPRKAASVKLSDDVKLAIRVARSSDATLTQLTALVDATDASDIERVVAATLKNKDDLKQSISWLNAVSKIKDPMALALEVSTLALQDVDRLVSIASLLGNLGAPVKGIKRTDISRSLLPVSQAVASLSTANKKVLAEISELLGG